MSKLRNELIKRLVDMEDDDEILKFLDTYVRLYKDKLKNIDNTSSIFGGGAGGSGLYYGGISSSAATVPPINTNPLDNSVYDNFPYYYFN